MTAVTCESPACLGIRKAETGDGTAPEGGFIFRISCDGGVTHAWPTFPPVGLTVSGSLPTPPAASSRRPMRVAPMRRPG